VSWDELNERVAQLSITEKSRDGTVRVTVSASGLVTDLVLKDRWHPQAPEEVAAQIMACIRRAQARIPELLRQAMFDTVGTQDPSSHLVLADARRRFPEVTDEAPRRPPERTDDGDWDGREVLEDA
jgi:DNA-binding protein YbaB